MIDFIFILRLLINLSKRERNEKNKNQRDELDNDPFGKEQKPKQILPARHKHNTCTKVTYTPLRMD